MRSSKESLKILFDNACNDKEGFIPLMNECYTNLEKDLEVLEILKKHIYFSSKSGCIRMKDIYKSINNFDFEDLREALEKCQVKKH